MCVWLCYSDDDGTEDEDEEDDGDNASEVVSHFSVVIITITNVVWLHRQHCSISVLFHWLAHSETKENRRGLQ